MTAIALFATNIGFMPCNTVRRAFRYPDYRERDCPVTVGRVL